jgi:hypothetical protein
LTFEIIVAKKGKLTKVAQTVLQGAKASIVEAAALLLYMPPIKTKL